MTWNNPPKFKSAPPKKGKVITPEMLAASGSEDGHQAALFCWAAMNADKYFQLKWLFAIPNGGSRHIVEATKFVGTGTRSGVPDVMLPCPVKMQWAAICPDDAYHGCFIEMKVGKNKTSKNQNEWIDYLTQAGYYCKVCYSWEEARDCLVNYLEGKL